MLPRFKPILREAEPKISQRCGDDGGHQVRIIQRWSHQNQNWIRWHELKEKIKGHQKGSIYTEKRAIKIVLQLSIKIHRS